MPLTDEHAFHLIDTLIALTSGMSDETTFRTKFVHPLIPTLNPSLSTIIQSKHETRDNWHPQI